MAEFAEGVPVTIHGMEDLNWTGPYPTMNYTSVVMMHYTVNQLTVLRVSTMYIYVHQCTFMYNVLHIV